MQCGGRDADERGGCGREQEIGGELREEQYEVRRGRAPKHGPDSQLAVAVDGLASVEDCDGGHEEDEGVGRPRGVGSGVGGVGRGRKVEESGDGRERREREEHEEAALGEEQAQFHGDGRD